jgi:hypothetical protein
MPRLTLFQKSIGFVLAFCLVQMRFLIRLDSKLPSCSEGITLQGSFCLAYDTIPATSTAPAAPAAAYSLNDNKDNAIVTDVELGVPQTMDPSHETAMLDRLNRARSYMKSEVAVDNKYKRVRNTCKLTYANCTYEALQGRCESYETSGKMSYQCAPVCETCEMVDYAVRCPMDAIESSGDDNNIMQTGDLDRTFQEIVGNPLFQKRLGLQVLSRPSYAAGDIAETATYQIGPYHGRTSGSTHCDGR